MTYFAFEEDFIVTENMSIKADCNAIYFENIGEVKAYVNNYPMEAGTGNKMVLNDPEVIEKTTYEIKFDPSGTGSKAVYVAKKNLRNATICRA